jgi:hypothetical protein
MSVMYFILLPLITRVLQRKVFLVLISIKRDNKSNLKADLFFLGLVLLVITSLVVVIERI